MKHRMNNGAVLQSSYSDNENSLNPVIDAQPIAVQPPLVSSYNDRIRPLLDAVDRLRKLNVMRKE